MQRLVFLILLSFTFTIQGYTQYKKETNPKEIIHQTTIDSLQNALENQSKEISTQYENLKDYKGIADTILYIIATLIAVLGIIVPVFIAIWGKNFFDNIKSQINTMQTNVNESNDGVKEKMKIFSDWYDLKKSAIETEQTNWLQKIENDIKEKHSLLEKDTRIKLSDIVHQAEDEYRKIKEMRETDEKIRIANEYTQNQTEQTENQYSSIIDFTKIVKNIEESQISTPFQKEFAKSLDLYLANKHKESIDLHLNILKNYKSEMTIDQLAAIYFRLGFSFFELTDYPSAIQYYQQFANINPSVSKVWSNLGLAFGALNKYDIALKMHNKAIEVNPIDINARNFLGLCYILCNKYEQALEVFKEMLEMFPNDKSTLYKIGVTNGLLGNYDEAISIYKKLDIIEPNNFETLIRILELLIITNQNSNELDSTLNKIAKNKDQEFRYKILNIITSIKSGTNQSNIDTIIQEIKQNFNEIQKPLDFNLIKDWIEKESEILNDFSRLQIKELIEKIEKWIAEKDK